MTSLNSDKLNFFHFKPKLSFLSENHKSNNWDGFKDFYGFTLYMTFAIFVIMSIWTMAIFMRNFKCHI